MKPSSVSSRPARRPSRPSPAGRCGTWRSHTESFDKRLFEIARRTGYRTIEVPGRGTINLDTDPFRLRRLSVHNLTTLPQLDKNGLIAAEHPHPPPVCLRPPGHPQHRGARRRGEDKAAACRRSGWTTPRASSDSPSDWAQRQRPCTCWFGLPADDPRARTAVPAARQEEECFRTGPWQETARNASG